MEVKKLFVSGRVQGVGYRYWAKSQADELKVSGWVRNLEDGRVEALLCGEPLAIHEFVSRAKKGPAQALVGDLVLEDFTLAELTPCDFSILR